jgi:hypothetical protein
MATDENPSERRGDPKGQGARESWIDIEEKGRYIFRLRHR